MTLEDEIVEAQLCFTNPPGNESNTCDWVIMPLLLAAGYSRRDIVSRFVDSTGQFPDYTILPDAPAATWYLEAKAWNWTLADVDSKQALNYANHNGKRFVVLTNGQLWRFYDNSIQGLLADKLITAAALNEREQIRTFLQALSKSEVLAGSLERFAEEERRRRDQIAAETRRQQELEEETRRARQRQEELRKLVRTTVIENLRDPANELLMVIALYLQDQPQFADVTPETVALAFAEAYWRRSSMFRPSHVTLRVCSRADPSTTGKANRV